MDHTYMTQTIHEILTSSRKSPEYCTVSLFTVLTHTFITKNEHVVLQTLCREHIIPPLVRAVRSDKYILSNLQDTLAAKPIPKLNFEEDVEATMQILYGSNRHAIRAFFTAINNGATDEAIARDLYAFTGPLRPDLETDPRGFSMHDQQREEAIARLLRFRDDLPQSDLFVILWNVCLNTQVHALTTFCQQTLNPLLVQSLVQRPSSLRVASLLQNELRGTQQAPQGNSRAPPDDARRRNEEQQRRQQDDQRQREYQRQQQQRQQEQEQRKQQEDERQREYQRQQQQRQQQQDHRQQEQREQQEDEQKQHPKTKRRFCPTTQKMREWIDNGAGRKKSQQILKRMDLNHDGMISQIEAIKACKKNSQDAADIGLPLGNIRQEDGTRNVFQSVFNEIDTNGDKQLDEVELLYQLWNMHKAKQN